MYPKSLCCFKQSQSLTLNIIFCIPGHQYYKQDMETCDSLQCRWIFSAMCRKSLKRLQSYVLYCFFYFVMLCFLKNSNNGKIHNQQSILENAKTQTANPESSKKCRWGKWKNINKLNKTLFDIELSIEVFFNTFLCALNDVPLLVR